ncbi:MAG: type VI secretion system lipoprotein TssJ [Spongiibacteraceae bacterium]
MAGYAGRALQFFALVALIFTIAGCSSNKPKPADFHIYSEADARLNLDFNAQPLSVVLNIYQLKDRQTFARLTFEDFVSGKSDESLLGEDIISKTELVVLPGNKQALNTQLAPDAQYLGVVAIYRTPADQQWRYLVPAEQIRKKSFWIFAKETTVSIRLHGCYIAIDGVEVDIIPGQKTNSSPNCSAAASNVSSTAIRETPAANNDSAPDAMDRLRTASEAADKISTTASSVSNGANAAKSLAKP